MYFLWSIWPPLLDVTMLVLGYQGYNSLLTHHIFSTSLRGPEYQCDSSLRTSISILHLSWVPTLLTLPNFLADSPDSPDSPDSLDSPDSPDSHACQFFNSSRADYRVMTVNPPSIVCH